MPRGRQRSPAARRLHQQPAGQRPPVPGPQQPRSAHPAVGQQSAAGAHRPVARRRGRLASALTTECAGQRERRHPPGAGRRPALFAPQLVPGAGGGRGHRGAPDERRTGAGGRAARGPGQAVSGRRRGAHRLAAGGLRAGGAWRHRHHHRRPGHRQNHHRGAPAGRAAEPGPGGRPAPAHAAGGAHRQSGGAAHRIDRRAAAKAAGGRGGARRHPHRGDHSAPAARHPPGQPPLPAPPRQPAARGPGGGGRSQHDRHGHDGQPAGRAGSTYPADSARRQGPAGQCGSRRGDGRPVPRRRPGPVHPGHGGLPAPGLRRRRQPLGRRRRRPRPADRHAAHQLAVQGHAGHR